LGTGELRLDPGSQKDKYGEYLGILATGNLKVLPHIINYKRKENIVNLKIGFYLT